MIYQRAGIEQLDPVFELVQETIKTIYPKFYPKEIVDFFCGLHSRENIKKDIENQNVGILIDNQILVGTGCRKENHITRVYVLPEYQGRGYGSYIIQTLEDEIAENFDSVWLDASASAELLYEKRGYTVKELCNWSRGNINMVYKRMEKMLAK